MAYRILVLEDDAAIRENLAAYLEDEGFTVEQAESGEQALEQLKTFTPELAIVDIRLPGMDGNAWISQAHTLQSKLQFLIYTGSMDYKIPNDLDALGLRSDQVMFKPIDMNVICEKIHQMLQP